ncbi:holocytochrome-c synthase [Malassezia cuniculi]|uniref:Holocytochrome c-type synthase n=1 Tax=Malassezia cuniculi TaxID=948313 RepID=A0AAF0EVH2_9BASI|nr:holocytochrome-c synthase [Malassezia cuniculi]
MSSWWPFSQQAAPAAGQQSACPVDHTTRERYVSECPVDHKTRETFLNESKGAAASTSSAHATDAQLSNEREVSSIPRYYPKDQDTEVVESAHADPEAASSGSGRDTHWVYPSASQFYNAVRRKNHATDAADMSVVVPIHNAVNEEAWKRILDWERGWRGKEGEDAKLVNFVGKPNELTWRARMRGFMGFQLPFDRHDWIIVRNGEDNPQQVRYIIDFYAGRGADSERRDMLNANPGVSFHLDVRPAPSTFEGIAMRMHRWWKEA